MQEKCFSYFKNILSLEVNLGSDGMKLFNEGEISEGQIGYSISTNGRILAGSKEGEWKQGWIVIGYENLLGDPIFIDNENHLCPVYKAEHGIGVWDPSLISPDIIAFCKSFNLLKDLENKSDKFIAEMEFIKAINIAKETLNNINAINQDSNIFFWRTIIDGYIEWVEEEMEEFE